MDKDKEKKVKALLETFSKLNVNSQAIILSSANCLLARQEMEDDKKSKLKRDDVKCQNCGSDQTKRSTTI